MRSPGGRVRGPDGLTDGERYARRSALDTRIVRHGCLTSFCKRAWDIIEPGRPFAWNWHMEVVCREGLEPISRGELKRLVICVPPRTTKSTLVSVLWPAWDWLENPWRAYMGIAKVKDLAGTHSRQMRQIVNSRWYQAIRAKRIEADPTLTQWIVKKDQNIKTNFVNSQGGARLALGIGDAVTGKGGDIQIIDDPLDAKEVVNGSAVQVANRLIECNNTVDIVLPTRLNSPAESARVIVMQRLAYDDPAGMKIRAGGWKVLNFPMEYEPDHESGTEHDIRTEPGELLFPARFPREVVEAYKVDLGARHYEAQYQQRPSPGQGALFRRAWFQNVFTWDPQRPKMSFDRVIMSVDAAFKGKVDSDFVAITVWGFKGPDSYLLGIVHDRMNYPETREAIKRTWGQFPFCNAVVIEDKANGPALVAELRKELPGVIPFNPGQNSKAVRANAAALYWEAGNVFVPTADHCPKIGTLIEEHIRFQDGVIHDDLVDSASQALLFQHHNEVTTAKDVVNRLAFLRTMGRGR